MKLKTFLKSILFLAILQVDATRPSRLALCGIKNFEATTSKLHAAFENLKYIKRNENGVFSITQPLYPEYTGAENFKLQPRRISEITMKGPPGYELPHYLVDPKDLVGPFETTQIETLVNSSEPFEIVGQGKIPTTPYSSCGRLIMRFQNKDTFSGSAAAIDRNLVVTAAHNLLPINYNNHPNVDKILAQEVRFEHMFLRDDPIINHAYSAKVSSHCFIHPKWIENFDPRYDIAFIFLSESLNLTQAQVDELLKLRIFDEKDTEIRVVGYPKDTNRMTETAGQIVEMQNPNRAIDSKEIIYHLANTEPGSSGSPIIADHIIGIHAYGASKDVPANSGVKIRDEIMKFLDESIDLHQNALANSTNLAKFRVQKEKEEKERQDRKLIEQGIEQGIAKGVEKGKQEEKKAIIIKMLKRNDNLQDIADFNEISVDEVKNIKNELDNSKKRAREE